MVTPLFLEIIERGDDGSQVLGYEEQEGIGIVAAVEQDVSRHVSLFCCIIWIVVAKV